MILIKYANLDLEDLYAARANGYCAEDEGDGTMWIEHAYESEEAVRADLDDMYGEVLNVVLAIPRRIHNRLM